MQVKRYWRVGVRCVDAVGFRNSIKERKFSWLDFDVRKVPAISLLNISHLLVELAHVELLDLLLQSCQIFSAAPHAQFALSLPSGVHGVLHSFTGVSHPLFVWHESFMKLLDLLQHLCNRVDCFLFKLKIYILRFCFKWVHFISSQKKGALFSWPKVCYWRRYKANHVSPSTGWVSFLFGSLMSLSFKFFSIFWNSTLMLLISLLRRTDGSIRIMLVSTASFIFLQREVLQNHWFLQTTLVSKNQIIFDTTKCKIWISPNLHVEFLYLLQLWQRETSHVAKAVQSGVNLQHPLPVLTVSGMLGVAMEKDERPHPLGGSLDVSDVFGPQNHAFMAFLTGRKLWAVAWSAFVTEDTGDASPTDALTCFRVTRRALRSLKVTVTS